VFGSPSPIAPANGITVSSLTPTLSWQAVNGASAYAIIVFDIFNNIVYQANVGSAIQHTIPSGELNYSNTYRWIAGVNVNGNICSSTSDLSGARIFYTPCADTFEPNDDPSQPNSTAFSALSSSSYNQSWTSYITSGTDIDHFELSILQAGELTITLSSLPNNYELELWGPSGVVSTSTNTSTTSEQITHTHSGGPQDY